MVEKVIVGTFGTDLQVTPFREYEVDESGSKIRIKPKGGKGHFMPSFTNTSYLDLPVRKRFILFGRLTYKRVYFVKKMASACVDFFTPFVPLPDPKQVMDAANSDLVKNYGTEEEKTPWYAWAGVIFGILNFFLLLSIAGVIR